jgi:hypothetical protein
MACCLQIGLESSVARSTNWLTTFNTLFLTTLQEILLCPTN